MTYGIVHGRFQLLHNGHLEGLLLPAKEKCDFLVVGICNPSNEQTKFDSINPHRSEQINNPFSYWERYLMIRNSLIDAGVSETDFAFVPFPINFPEQIENYVPSGATHFITIYDNWGRKKFEELRNQGFDVEILKEVSLAEKGYGGSELRQMIVSGNSDWQNYVPKAVSKIVLELGLDEKLK